MTPAEQAAAGAAPAATTTTAGASILEDAIKATKQTERSRAEELLQTLVDEAMKGTFTWNKNVTNTVKQGMKAIDEALSKQLAAILHNPDFQKLEGTWRGLIYLVMNTETSTNLKLKVF